MTTAQGLLGTVKGWFGPKAEKTGPLPVRDRVDVGGSRPVQLMAFDQALVWVVVGLLALGLVMVYSASVALPDSPKFARYAHTHFLTRHAMQIGLAVLATVDSAQFKFDVDAPAGVVVVLKVEGREIKPGKVYETAPFLGERTLAFEVTWTEAGVTRAKA